jgi:hypothetical protein
MEQAIMGPAAMPAPVIFVGKIRRPEAVPASFIFAGKIRVPVSQPSPFGLDALISIASATRAATNCDAVPLQNGSK